MRLPVAASRVNNGAPGLANKASVAWRCSAPISTGLSSFVFLTQACSHSTSVGQTRAHMPPSGFASKIALAAPRRLSWAMRWIKLGMSMPVGQAVWQGAS